MLGARRDAVTAARLHSVRGDSAPPARVPAPRARRLYADREAVVDGERRWTYADFGARCDRASAAFATLGVRRHDRVAYIAPNTHAQLESFYAVPRARRRARADQLSSRRRRARVPDRAQRREGRVHARRLPRHGRPDPRARPRCRSLRRARGCAAGLARLRAAARRGTRGRRGGMAGAGRDRLVDDQLHERHDLASQGRDDHAPERVPERGRHARPRPPRGRRALPVDAADVPRQRLDVHLDHHRRRRHPHMPAQGRAEGGVRRGGRGARSRCCALRRPS